MFRSVCTIPALLAALVSTAMARSDAANLPGKSYFMTLKDPLPRGAQFEFNGNTPAGKPVDDPRSIRLDSNTRSMELQSGQFYSCLVYRNHRDAHVQVLFSERSATSAHPRISHFLLDLTLGPDDGTATYRNVVKVTPLYYCWYPDSRSAPVYWPKGAPEVHFQVPPDGQDSADRRFLSQFFEVDELGKGYLEIPDQVAAFPTLAEPAPASAGATP